MLVTTTDAEAAPLRWLEREPLALAGTVPELEPARSWVRVPIEVTSAVVLATPPLRAPVRVPTPPTTGALDALAAPLRSPERAPAGVAFAVELDAPARSWVRVPAGDT